MALGQLNRLVLWGGFRKANERPLSHEEEDIVALAYWAVNQNNLPEQMLERHSMILDFYLKACPVQVYGIMDLIGNFENEDWD